MCSVYVCLLRKVIIVCMYVNGLSMYGLRLTVVESLWRTRGIYWKWLWGKSWEYVYVEVSSSFSDCACYSYCGCGFTCSARFTSYKDGCQQSWCLPACEGSMCEYFVSDMCMDGLALVEALWRPTGILLEIGIRLWKWVHTGVGACGLCQYL